MLMYFPAAMIVKLSGYLQNHPFWGGWYAATTVASLHVKGAEACRKGAILQIVQIVNSITSVE